MGPVSQIPYILLNNPSAQERYSPASEEFSIDHLEEGSPIPGQLGDYLIKKTLNRQEAEALFKQTGLWVTFTPGRNQRSYSIDSGHFGNIYLALKNEEYFAVKVTREKGITEESHIQRALKGLPYILEQTESCYVKDSQTLYQIFSPAGLGSVENLQKHLFFLQDNALKKAILYHIAHALLTGLAGMHRKGYYHLDIKPSNLVIDQKGEPFIIDFGCAAHSSDNQIPSTANGDKWYFSPERKALSDIPSKTFAGDKVDAFAAGLTLDELANNGCGLTSSSFWQDPELDSLISQLTLSDPQKRKTPQDLLNHPACQPGSEKIRAYLREYIYANAPHSILGPQDLPLPQFASYTRRPSLEETLTSHLFSNPLTVMQGSGGIGKTQLATYLLYKSAIFKHYPTKLWFRHADNSSQLDVQFRSVAIEWDLIEKTAPAEEAIEKVHQKLQTKGPFFIVFDNAESYESLEKYLPQGGTILVTTRFPNWPSTCSIPPLTPQEGEALITQSLGPSDQAATLSKSLGHLPLALVQACAYIRNTESSLIDYLNLLKKQPKFVLSEDQPFLGKNLPGSMFSTWQATIALLAKHPDAFALLDRLAYLGEELSLPLLESLTNNNNTLDILVRYALLEKRGEILSIPKLNQDLIQLQHKPLAAMALRVELMETFNKYYTRDPTSSQDKEINASLILHGEALIAKAEEFTYFHEKEIRAVRNTYSWLGNAYKSLGQWDVKEFDLSDALKNQKTQTIENYKQRVLLNWRLYPPEGHPTIARDLESLGDAYISNEDFKKGIKTYRNALIVALNCFDNTPLIDKVIKIEQKLGLTLKEFGNSLKESGKKNEALPYLKEGKFHLESALSRPMSSEDRAYCLMEIAELYEWLENPQQEIDTYKQALKLYQHLFGYDDPEAVAKTLHTLAIALQNNGQVQKAIPYLKEALRIRIKAYGKNHLKVATRHHALGLAYKTLKDPQGIEHLTKALEIYQKLGEEEAAAADVLEDIQT